MEEACLHQSYLGRDESLEAYWGVLLIRLLFILRGNLRRDVVLCMRLAKHDFPHLRHRANACMGVRLFALRVRCLQHFA